MNTKKKKRKTRKVLTEAEEKEGNRIGSQAFTASERSMWHRAVVLKLSSNPAQVPQALQ